MKNQFLWIAVAAFLVLFTACSKDDDPIIIIPDEFAEVTFEEGIKTHTITFTANQSWMASILSTRDSEIDWLNVSPQRGDAGEATITVSVKGNYTLEDRTAYVHIIVDGLSKSIPVMQTGIPQLAEDKPTQKKSSDGFFVVNEDWFGHDNGTVNYFKRNGTDYDITYRAYRAVNTTEADWLGVTTQFATIWGDYAYFSSKQGNRLVVADAKTMKKKAIFTNLGGDGRTFVGIDDKKGYMGHSAGIVVFDIAKMEVGPQIEGVSSQIGSMCTANGRVFAVSQSNGLYVIDAQNDKVEETIAGTYYTLTRSKDGNVWVASSAGLVKIDPYTLEKETVAYPTGATIGSSWGAWNAGTLCASTQNNVLYWAPGGGFLGGGKTIVKYDINTKTANTSLFTLGISDYATQMSLYGAGLRVDPLTDEVILTVKHNGFSDTYNWIYKLDANGNETAKIEYFGDNGTASIYKPEGGYWWFPAVPFFEDANKPQILLNQILVKAGKTTVVKLDEKIVDYDNSMSSILKSVDFSGSDLVTYTLDGNDLTIKAGNDPGSSTGVITVVSNGVRVEKTIRIDVEM